ncbi:hypothetical protein GOODEAATRI_016222, partial [Goodea atripinnis]
LVVGALMRGSPVVTLSDGLTSLSAGMISRLPLLVMRGCELSAYVYVWDHFRLWELPWDSAWTWWLTFLGVDFCYYWVHRFAHACSGCFFEVTDGHTVLSSCSLPRGYKSFFLLLPEGSCFVGPQDQAVTILACRQQQPLRQTDVLSTPSLSCNPTETQAMWMLLFKKGAPPVCGMGRWGLECPLTARSP